MKSREFKQSTSYAETLPDWTSLTVCVVSLKAFSFAVLLPTVELSVYKAKRPVDALPFQCSVNITKCHLSMAVPCFYSHSLDVNQPNGEDLEPWYLYLVFLTGATYCVACHF